MPVPNGNRCHIVHLNANKTVEKRYSPMNNGCHEGIESKIKILFKITSRVVNQISIRWRFKKNMKWPRVHDTMLYLLSIVCTYLFMYFMLNSYCACIQGCIHRDRHKSSDSSQKGGNEYKSIWTKYHERKGETVKFRSKKKSRGYCISSLCRRAFNITHYVATRLSWYGKIHKRRLAAGLSTAACHWWFMTPSTPHTHFLGLLLLLYIYIYIFMYYIEIFAFAHERRLRHTHFIFYL